MRRAAAVSLRTFTTRSSSTSSTWALRGAAAVGIAAAATALHQSSSVLLEDDSDRRMKAIALSRSLLEDDSVMLRSAVEAARERVAQIALALTASADAEIDAALDLEGVGLRVVFGRKEADFAYLSGASQPYPFVAAATEALLRAGQRDTMELLEMIGFTREWVQDKIDGGTQFRLVIFALQDAATTYADDGTPAIVYEPITPTWDGLLELVRDGGLGFTANPTIAEFLEPHIDTFKELSARGPEGWAELQTIAARVDKVDRAVYAQLSSFEAFEALVKDGDASMEEFDDIHKARGFLRHSLKCTSLFAGDGFTRTEAGEQGCEERLVRRCRIVDLPNHCWVPLGCSGEGGGGGAGGGDAAAAPP